MSCDSEVRSALKLCSLSSPISCPTAAVGVALWTNQYMTHRPSIHTLESSVTMAMDEYDMRAEVDKEKRRKASIPDDDGWTTVTSRGSKRKVSVYRYSLQPGLIVGSLHLQLTDDTAGGNRRKAKKKELLNFYSWQLRESQRDEIAKLRYKFQEDKERVAALRAARRFKPY